MVHEPSFVRIDGEEAHDWTYDEVLRRLTVNVPTRPCSETIVVNVKEKETGIKDPKDYKDPKDLKGPKADRFDLLGRQMVNSHRSKGIYIQNGKKTLNPYKP